MMSQGFTLAAISGFACWFWLWVLHALFGTPDIGLAVGLALATVIVISVIRSAHRTGDRASDGRLIAQER
jgi:multisubunit Na+/H+ antiporter MnhB subunit